MGVWAVILLILFSVAAAVTQLGPSFYLAEWAKKEFKEQQLKYYPMMFGLSILVFIVITTIRAFVTFWILITSTNSLHSQMTEKVLRARILFYDSNPIGRIIARFSKDIAVFDMVVPVLIIMVIQGLLRALTVSITVIIIDPYLAIPVAACVAFMFFIMKQGKPAMVDG